ncbi:MAG: hypothetical protein QN141_01345 [Armatimonadota bacterium]|nr:hypothetical protein [Armatimonadota bacterium]MDR7451075.1 hypothetical protein [Armatimonadota bacterium]MDR7465904.1 hypothetical protein [Armatimonadota bacterium]MDR7493969.1 hypothetical protein [Armatimonadota bacterium]MDR7498419.1 hypothetical protein [Armatimonadota bacterium]
MYLHLGGESVVAVLDVVAILDIRVLEGSEVNREFLDRAVADRRLRGDGLSPGCKALVVARDRTVFTSGLSASTLARRMTHLRRSMSAWGAEK